MSPKMLVADGVAYLTFPSSSTIKMTSEVSWTRVRKYASLPWRITSSRSMIRSTARATWCARISSVAARPARMRCSPNTASTPMSGSPDGRSLSVSGHSSIQSYPGTIAAACGGKLVTGARIGAEPVTSGSQPSARSVSRLIGAGSAEAVATARTAPSVRTASSTSPRGPRPSRVSVADLTAAPACSTVIADTRDAPACRTARSRPSARPCEAATSDSRDSTSR